MLKSKEEQADLFKSLKKEEFDKLPRPSIENLQRALDKGKPQPDDLSAGAFTVPVDSQMRFF